VRLGLGLDRVDLGIGVGRREDHRAGVHRRHVTAFDQVGGRHPDEHVRTGDRVMNGPDQPGGVRHPGHLGEVGIHPCPPAVNDPGDIDGDDVLGALQQQQPDDGTSRRPDTGHHDPAVVSVAQWHLGRHLDLPAEVDQERPVRELADLTPSQIVDGGRDLVGVRR
jgi:hypothetical protein